jgi:thymidine phosphorylase
MRAATAGECVEIDNRRIARIAKLAGAPNSPAAGVELHVRIGQKLEKGASLFTVHAQAPGELDYALNYAGRQSDVIRLEAR